jgi:lipopolysaccharide/colanic/teichoic acid biosynthesis glycosyltransferase
MVKRLFDIMVGLIGLTMLSPILLGIALAIKLTSPGPVFYKASKVGKDGVLFRVYKFRPMVVDAAPLGGAVTRAGVSVCVGGKGMVPTTVLRSLSGWSC